MAIDTDLRPGTLHGRQFLWGLIPVALALLLSIFPVFAGDIWMHLACARYMVETESVPTTDPFLYTTPPDRRFVNHSWGSQLAYFAAYDLAGPNGLVGFRMLLAALGAGLFWLLAVRRGATPFLAAALVTAAVSLAARSYITRPLMVTAPCVAGILLLLRRPTWPRIAGALALQCLWANLHASFPLGIVAGGALAVESTVAARFRSTVAGADDFARFEWQRLWIFIPLAITISLVNPNSYELYFYIWDLQHLDWMRTTVREWMAPDWAKTHNQQFLGAAGVTFVLLILHAATRRRISLALAMLFGLFAWQAIGARRFIPMAVMFAAPLMAVALSDMIRSARLRTLLALLVMSGTAVLSVNLVQARLTTDRFRMGINDLLLPVRAVEFLKANEIKGNLACAPYAGGYLLWAYPAATPATDGRCLVNDPATIQAFNALARGRPGWEKAFPEPGVSDVMLLESTYAYTPLHTRLVKMSDNGQITLNDWAVAYWDEYWMVLVRTDGKYGTLASEAMTFSAPTILHQVYGSLSTPQRKAVFDLLRARVAQADTGDRAFGVARPLLGYMLYGKAMETLSAAFEQRQRIAKAPPADKQAAHDRFNLLQNQTRRYLEESSKLMLTDIEENPGQSRSRYALARNLVWLGEYEEAARLIEQAALIDPLTWIHFDATLRHHLDYLNAVNDRESPSLQDARALHDWFRASAQDDRPRILNELRIMHREREMPDWLAE